MRWGHGFKDIVKRAVIYVLLFVLVPLLGNVLNGKDVPQDFIPIDHITLGSIVLFTAVCFFILTKKKILKIRRFKVKASDILVFGLLFILSFAGFVSLKSFIIDNLAYASQNIFLFTSLRYLLMFLAAATLFVAVFGFEFVRFIFCDFLKEIKICILLFLGFVVLVLLGHFFWIYLSSFVTYLVYLILLVIFPDLVVYRGAINLGLDGFVVEIGSVCSGIESIILFTALFFLIYFMDYDKLVRKRMWILLLPGLFSVLLLNAIRIAVLIIIGKFYSPDFAIGFFHTNAGWVLFLIYFWIFWYFAYPWVRK